MKILRVFPILMLIYSPQTIAATSVSVGPLSIEIDTPRSYSETCTWVLYDDGYIRNTCYPNEVYIQNNFPYYDAPYYFYNDYGFIRPFYGRGVRSFYAGHQIHKRIDHHGKHVNRGHHNYKGEAHHKVKKSGKHHKAGDKGTHKGSGAHHKAGGGGHKGANRDGKGGRGGHR